jgi:hypothetical protein
MTAFLFVPLLAFAWIFGLAVAAHAAHYFLSIVEGSATGLARNISSRRGSFRTGIRDCVDWPDDHLTDYFAKMFYLGYMVALWGGPAVLVGRLIAGPTPLAAIIAGVAFWLFFPIGQLSSLASGSRWNPFWSEILVAFAKRPGKTLAFYVLSAPVLAGLIFTFDLVLVHSSKVTAAWSIALAPVAVLLFFIYARLLGRLGMVVSYALPREEVAQETRPKRKRPTLAYDPKTRWTVPKETSDVPASDAQPTDLPGLETPNDGIVTGYGVSYDNGPPPAEEPKPARIVHKFDDEDDSPITMAPPTDTRGTDRERIANAMAEPPEHEIELYLRERPSEPANPYGAASVTFLFDLKTIDPWFRLTVGLIGMAILQRALDVLRPPID